MFKIDKTKPWPPALDLSDLRALLKRLRNDVGILPQLAGFDRALAKAMDELDRAEAADKASRSLLSPTPTSFLHRGNS